MSSVTSVRKSELFFKEIFPVYKGFILSRSIYAITKLKVAEELIAGPLSIVDLAKRLNITYASNLERVLNFLVSNDIFTKADGHYSHSNLSQDLLWERSGKKIIKHQDMRWGALADANEQHTQANIAALQDENDTPQPVERLARLYVQARAIYVACGLKVFEKIENGTAVENVLLSQLAQMGLTSNQNLTETGKLFLDKNCQAFILYDNADRWNALASLEDSITEGIVPFEKTMGCSYFEYISTRPEATRLFSDAMTFVSEYEFARLLPCLKNVLRSGCTVADIGGGQGLYIQEILNAYPDVGGILFDLKENIGSCVVDEATLTRCQLVPGDFFKEIPSADVFLFKRVLHDWNDEDCVKILSNCAKAALANTQLVLHEMMLPEPEALMFDVQFMTYIKGQQRTLEDFMRILDMSGWSLVSTMKTGCWISQIVAIRK